MLFWLGPLLVLIAVTFFNVATFNRGDFLSSLVIGMFFAFVSCLGFMALIPIIAGENAEKVLIFNKQITGEVSSSLQDDGSIIYGFEYDGKKEFVTTDLEDTGDVNVLTTNTQDFSEYSRVCQYMPSWAAPFGSNCDDTIIIGTGGK